MTQFFTSDHHFGHGNILRYCEQTRPFGSLEAMHEHYRERWNDVVRPTDVVWYVGDFALKLAFVAAFLGRLHGEKHLVVGNHDTCFKLQPRQVGRYRAAGFQTVQRQCLVELGSLTFVVCHFPYRVPEEALSPDPRVAERQRRSAPFAAVPGEHNEVALIHGHVHQYWRARVGIQPLPELNVAVDAWDGTPVAEAQLLELYAQAAARPGPQLLTHDGHWEEAARLPEQG